MSQEQTRAGLLSPSLLHWFTVYPLSFSQALLLVRMGFIPTCEILKKKINSDDQQSICLDKG